MVRLETSADVLEAGKASQEQTGADEEQHREGKLRCDENATETLMARAGSGTARALVEGFAEIEPGGAKSRRDTEDETGDDGNQDGEQEHGTIEPNSES